jgi:hypothetical protein
MFLDSIRGLKKFLENFFFKFIFFFKKALFYFGNLQTFHHHKNQFNINIMEELFGWYLCIYNKLWSHKIGKDEDILIIIKIIFWSKIKIKIRKKFLFLKLKILKYIYFYLNSHYSLHKILLNKNNLEVGFSFFLGIQDN